MAINNPEGNGPMVEGNQIWKLRPFNAGPERLIKTPEQLIQFVIDYFTWADENPTTEKVIGWYQGEATEHEIEHVRPYTIAGLVAFIGTNRSEWSRWKRERHDLVEAMLWAEAQMYEQKFAYASAGLMNANLIARDLGLAEISDHTSSDGTMSPKPTLIEFLAPEIVPPEAPVAVLPTEPADGASG